MAFFCETSVKRPLTFTGIFISTPRTPDRRTHTTWALYKNSATLVTRGSGTVKRPKTGTEHPTLHHDPRHSHGRVKSSQALSQRRQSVVIHDSCTI